jgi:NAD+ synthase (glutamine-hydrolysing)
MNKFGYLRVAACSPEMRIADVEFNISEIENIIKNNSEKNIDIFLFPELCVTGYTCADLFYQQPLLDAAKKSLERLEEISFDYKTGIIAGLPIAQDGKLYNAAAFINNGQLIGIVPKTYLCNQNEYYEARWFSSEFERVFDSINLSGREIPFGTDIVFSCANFPGLKFGIEICEDLWAVKPVSSDAALAGASVIFNLSASNEYLGKLNYREENVKMHSGRLISGYVYSSCGPNESSTDTVFSGQCMVYENASRLAISERFNFKSTVLIADLDIELLNNERLKNKTFGKELPDKEFRVIDFELQITDNENIIRDYRKNPFIPSSDEARKVVCNEIADIQAAGLLKRLAHIGVKSCVIGISGGLDSTLAMLSTIYAYKKAGRDISDIHCISMPGPGTGRRTKSNADLLGSEFGITFEKIEINEWVENHLKHLGHKGEKDVTFENAQARARTMILMDYANKIGGIVIGTGDLSETALGWSTYNGDHMSMYNLNSGIPKTLVREVVAWFATEYFKGDKDKSNLLEDIINTPISPELLPADEKGEIQQKTEEKIGPYDVHDFFLYYFFRYNFTPEKILFLAKKAFKGEFSENRLKEWLDIFVKRFFSNQFKRSAMPDGLKIGTVSLSPRAEWRMPSDAISKIWRLI